MKAPGILIAIIAAGLAAATVTAQSTLPKAEQDSLWAIWTDPTQADTGSKPSRKYPTKAT